MKKIVYILAVNIIFLISCEKFDGPENTSISTYDVFWNLIDENYAAFDLKPNMNWQEINNHYINLVNANTTQDELWVIFSAMLDSLNDKHVFISNSDKSDVYFSGGIGKARMNNTDWLKDYYKSFPFDLDIIKQNYLINPQSSGYNEEEERDILTYGYLSESAFYIHISTFFPANGVNSPGDWTSDFESILKENKVAERLIIDVRNNSGGLDTNVQKIASFFVDKQLIYSSTIPKTGPGYNDFDNPYENSILPDGGFYFSKPVTVITNKSSMSNAEWFAYAMSLNKAITTVGNYTAGATLGINGVDLLPNGWLLQISRELNYTEKGESFESIGYAPDVLVQNMEDDIANGIDKCLEEAMLN